MNVTGSCMITGTTPGANGGLDPGDKIQASCLFEVTRLDVCEKVADFLLEPMTLVNNVNGRQSRIMDLPNSYVSSGGVIPCGPWSDGLAVNGLPLLCNVTHLLGVTRLALWWP
jgi:hypothetical protein